MSPKARRESITYDRPVEAPYLTLPENARQQLVAAQSIPPRTAERDSGLLRTTTPLILQGGMPNYNIEGSYYGQPLPNAPVTKFETAQAAKMSNLPINAQAMTSNVWNTFPTTTMNDIWNRGYVPAMTFGMWDLNNHANDYALRHSQIAAGVFDSQLTTWFQGAAAFGHPFLFRLYHEFNFAMQTNPQFPWIVASFSNWYGTGVSWTNTLADFIASWRRVKLLAMNAGATNASFALCYNIKGNNNNHTSPGTGYYDYWEYYPGDEYVDVVSLDGYNYGVWNGNTWLEWSQVFRGPNGTPSLSWLDDSYAKVIAQGAGHKDVWVAEFGSDSQKTTVHTYDYASKASWYTTALTRMQPDYPRIFAISYFEWNALGYGKPDQDITIVDAGDESVTAATTAWRNGIARPEYAKATDGVPPTAWYGDKRPIVGAPTKPASEPIMHGAWPGASFDTATINAWNAWAGKNMQVSHFGWSWANMVGFVPGVLANYRAFPTGTMQSEWDAGRVCAVEWDSWNLSDQYNVNFNLPSVIRGDHDVYIHQFARDAKAWGHPFFLKHNVEMNIGAWPWSEDRAGMGNSNGDYVRAWRHVHDIFVAEGCLNATWAWIVNNAAPLGANTPSGAPLSRFYPGDDYVDWWGFDGFNFADQNGSPWMSFEQLITGYPGWLRDIYSELIALSTRQIPMWAMSVGCHTSGTVSVNVGQSGPGNRPMWLVEAFNAIKYRFPRIKQWGYFNWNSGDGLWELTDTPSRTAYKNMQTDPWFLSTAIPTMANRPPDGGIIPAYSLTPPSITVQLPSPGQTSVTIVWTADQVGTTQVQYRKQGDTAWITSPLDSKLGWNHSVTLSSLLPNTNYEYQALMVGGWGANANSGTLTFRTLGATTHKTYDGDTLGQAGLILYAPCNEKTGTVIADKSPGARNGTVVPAGGSVVLGRKLPSGEWTTGLQPSGGGHVDFGDADPFSIPTTGQLTIEVVIAFATLPTTRMAIVAKGGDQTIGGVFGQYEYEFYLDASGTAGFCQLGCITWENNGNTRTSFATRMTQVPILLGRPYHVGVTFDQASPGGGMGRLFCEGVQIGPGADPHSGDNAGGALGNAGAPLWIGGRANTTPDHLLSGVVVGRLALYSQAKTATWWPGRALLSKQLAMHRMVSTSA